MCRRRSRGLSLIEVIVFLLVVGTALAALLMLFMQTTRASADPLVRKQALAIATSLMEEIQLRAFTFCDPDDASVHTATAPAGCATAEAIGPESGGGAETRYAAPRFDNASDYHGFGMGVLHPAAPDIRSVDGTVIPGLAAYDVAVEVAQAGADFGMPADAALRITVTVRHPGTALELALQSYRLRYAPNHP